MPQHRLLIIPLLTSLTLGAACVKVASPPGYEELKATHQPKVIQATPYKMYGIAPRSYDLPDKRQVTIKVDDYQKTSGMGMYRINMAYEIALGDRVLSCATQPNGPNTPKTRFGCWSVDEQEPVTLWLAPERACEDQDLGASQTLLRPECWQAVLTTPKQRYNVELGYVEGLESPVHYLSWTDARGAAVQAANSVAELRVELWQTTTTSLDLEEQDRLTLSAMALHYWLHAQDPS